MAIRGNRPKPTALKLLAGNPSGRPVNDREPKASGPIGDCPDWFPDEAKEEWGRIVPEMVRLGVFAGIDRAVIEGHCLTYADMIRTAKAGEPLRATVLAQLRFYASELGLSPTSRARLKTPEKDNGDPTEEFFKVA